MAQQDNVNSQGEISPAIDSAGGGPYHPSMLRRKLRLLVPTYGLVLLGAGATVLGLGAQGAAKCPPIIASLMPKGARILAGHYNTAGQVSLGGAGAELPFDHICTRSTKYPGHMGFDVQHYEGDAIKLFKTQVDAVEKETLKAERAEMERRRAAVRKSTSILEQINDLKTELLPGGGTLLYYDFYLDCSEDGIKRSHPEVRLLGVAHTGSSKITVKIDGFMSAEAARTAAMEVIANFLKADFGRAEKGT